MPLVDLAFVTGAEASRIRDVEDQTLGADWRKSELVHRAPLNPAIFMGVPEPSTGPFLGFRHFGSC